MLGEENYSLATFCVIVKQLYCYVNKGQAVWFGLAWLPAVCENVVKFVNIFLFSLNEEMMKDKRAFLSRTPTRVVFRHGPHSCWKDD